MTLFLTEAAHKKTDGYILFFSLTSQFVGNQALQMLKLIGTGTEKKGVFSDMSPLTSSC